MLSPLARKYAPLLLLLGASACHRQHTLVPKQNITNIDGQAQQQYFTAGLHRGNYTNVVIAAEMERMAKQDWQAIRHIEFEPLQDYYTYFGKALSHKQSGIDSIAAIAKAVYGCSIFGWMPTQVSNDEFLALNSTAQYNAMLRHTYNGRCTALSGFLANTLSTFGYPSVVVKLAVEDSINGHHEHAATAVMCQDQWYIVEATTGQLMMDSKGRYLSYDKYLQQVNSRQLDDISFTPSSYGKFIQPSPYKGRIAWIYGAENDASISKQTSSYTVIKTKRDIQYWQQEETVRGSYLAAINTIYGQPNWLYMYNCKNIIGVMGSQQAQTLFSQYYH